MSQADKLAEARLQGMRYAYEQIKRDGIDEFKKELAWRNRNNISMLKTKQEMKEESFKMESILYVRMAVNFYTLMNDMWGIGRKRIKQFNERYNGRLADMYNHFFEWDDYKKEFEKILGEPFEMELVKPF